MQKTWYCIMYYYPWGLPKIKYLTHLPADVKERGEQNKKKRSPTKIICSFRLTDLNGNFLEQINLASVIHSLKIEGYREARLILSEKPRPNLSYEKEVFAVRLPGDILVLTDRVKKYTPSEKNWRKALIKLLGIRR